MSTCILNEVGGTVSERGCVSVVVQQDGQMLHHGSAALLSQVRGQSETPRTSRSLGFGRMTHDTTSQQQRIVPGSTQCCYST